MLYRALIICSLLIVCSACKNTTEQPEIITVETAPKEVGQKQVQNRKASYALAEFNIEGMTCAMGCAKVIENKLANLEGVKQAKVNFETKQAEVEFDQAILKPNKLSETVTGAGEAYSVSGDIKVTAK